MGKVLTYEEIRDYVNSEETGNGCELLTDKISFDEEKIKQGKDNSHVKLQIKCNCNHSFIKCINKFKSGQKRCNYCAGRSTSEKLKLDPNYISILLKDLGYTLEGKYKDAKTKFTCYDNEGYYYTGRIYEFIKNKNINQYRFDYRFDFRNSFSIFNMKKHCIKNNRAADLISEHNVGSKCKLKWKCLKECCEEIFEMTWSHFQSGEGCPFCSGKRVGKSNCLATRNPKVSSEWNYDKNNIEVNPYNIYYNSNFKYWWKCDKGHEWDDTVRNRQYLSKCPYCIHIYPTPEYNFLTENPKIYEDWDYIKNKKRPEEYLPNSNIRVWWKCKKCGHEWNSYIYSRNTGHGCPKCAIYNNSGNMNYAWKDSITDEERKNKRHYPEYYQFINDVLKRDNYTCRITGIVGNKLCVHHLDGYNWCKDKREDIDNGITLIEEIHTLFHKEYGYRNNTKEQFIEFIKRFDNHEFDKQLKESA